MRIKHRRGFTLIELVMVAALAAILAGIAIPRLSGNLRMHRLNAAARRVAGDLNYAAAKARAASETRTVVFTVSSSAYRIPQEKPLHKDSGSYAVSLQDDPYWVSISEVNFNSTTTATFDGYGRPASGGYVKVSIDGVTRTIAVDADSGKAVIQ